MCVGILYEEGDYADTLYVLGEGEVELHHGKQKSDLKSPKKGSTRHLRVDPSPTRVSCKIERGGRDLHVDAIGLLTTKQFGDVFGTEFLANVAGGCAFTCLLWFGI